MTLLTLEREILRELKKATGDYKLKMKDIMEWSTSEVKAQEGEKLIRLKELGVYVAYKC